MGSLGDSMQTVVDEITALAEDRRSQLGELADQTREDRARWRSQSHEAARQALDDIRKANNQQRLDTSQLRADACDLVRRLRLERRTTAQGLRGKLASERSQRLSEHRVQLAAGNRDRLGAARATVYELHIANELRGNTVARLRSGALDLVRRFGSERRDVAEGLRQTLSSESRSLRESVQEMKRSLQETAHELSSDVSRARRIWTARLARSRKAGFATETQPVEAKTHRPKRAPESAVTDEKRVLNAIARHPEGIRLADIGNELGVDWRSLTGPSKSLVDQGRIEKVDTVYYPKESGGQRQGGEA